MARIRDQAPGDAGRLEYSETYGSRYQYLDQETYMRMSIDEARSLLEAVMRNLGYGDGDDKIIADHLIDCELRGLHQGGMARALSIAEQIARTSGGRGPIRIIRETAISAQIDGGDNIGYVVARRATQLAIEKASKSGIAIVGARNT